MYRLDQCYLEFAETKLDTEDDEDAVVDLELFESYLAGIADSILKCRAAEEMNKEILKHKILRGDRLQPYLRNADGAVRPDYDISHLPAVLYYARAVEELRKACFAIVFGTRH